MTVRIYTLVQLTEWQVMYENNQKLAEAGLLPATLAELTVNYNLEGCRSVPRAGLCPIE